MMTVSIEEMKKYIESLDLYILSHGGVGSNYLVDYLKSKNLSVMTNLKLHEWTCHYPYKLVPNKNTLYLYGSVIESIISQHRRNCLHINATKIHEARDYKHEYLEYFIKKYPDDPIGIKKQYNNLKNTENTILIRYPYTKNSVEDALKQLGYNIDFTDFSIKERETKDFNMEDMNSYPPVLQEVIRAYIGFDFD